jgi:hypothetical protein
MHILQTLSPPESLAMPIDAATRLAEIGNQLQVYSKASTTRGADGAKKRVEEFERAGSYEHHLGLWVRCGYDCHFEQLQTPKNTPWTRAPGVLDPAPSVAAFRCLESTRVHSVLLTYTDMHTTKVVQP